jgi:hypothetical protein
VITASLGWSRRSPVVTWVGVFVRDLGVSVGSFPGAAGSPAIELALSRGAVVQHDRALGPGGFVRDVRVEVALVVVVLVDRALGGGRVEFRAQRVSDRLLLPPPTVGKPSFRPHRPRGILTRVARARVEAQGTAAAQYPQAGKPRRQPMPNSERLVDRSRRPILVRSRGTMVSDALRRAH